MHAEIIFLRLLHVVGGMLWVGFAAYNTFFLIPAFADAGPAAAPVFGGLQKRKLFVFLPIIATLTILSGVRLLMIASEGFSAAFFQTRMGLTFTGGGAIGIVGFVIGLLLTRPSMDKAGALMAKRGTASPEEQREIDAKVAKLRALGATSGLWSTALILIAGVAMAVARYL